MAAVGSRPPLREANSDEERHHWLTIAHGLKTAFLGTYPKGALYDGNSREPLETDQAVMNLVAGRVFELPVADGENLWKGIVSLPSKAKFQVTSFLDSLLGHALREEDGIGAIRKLIPIWKSLATTLMKKTPHSSYDHREILSHVFLYGAPYQSETDDTLSPLFLSLKDLLRQHVVGLVDEARVQSQLIGLVLSDTGLKVLAELLEWLNPIWENSTNYFWDEAATLTAFSDLIEKCTTEHFDLIQVNPDALSALKHLITQLSAKQHPAAIEAQGWVGISIN